MRKFWSEMKHGPWQLVLADVWLGMKQVSHNMFAVLGLSVAVAAAVLLAPSQARRHIETEALDWLAQRAFVRESQATGAVQAPALTPAQVNILPEVAEPEAIARATAIDPAELSRQQSAVVSWIARRYAVAPEPISKLAQEAWSVGRKAGIDPTLILAVMAIESGFNPFAQSHVGAQGLMQVMTTIHQDKYAIFGGRKAAFDPVTNLKVGVQILKDCIARAGSLEAGLKFYVGAANLPHDGGYAAKVLAERAYLQDVMLGRKVATTAALPQFSGAAVAVNTTTQPDDPEAKGADKSVSVAAQAAELLKHLPGAGNLMQAGAAGSDALSPGHGPAVQLPAVIRMTPAEPAATPASAPSMDAIDHVALAR